VRKEGVSKRKEKRRKVRKEEGQKQIHEYLCLLMSFQKNQKNHNNIS
jgi:hypothetical protein